MAVKKNKKIQGSKLCLNMIVKNEAHLKDGVSIIERCLNNVGHLLDAVAIVDTGSNDNTIKLIEEWAKKKDLPCRVEIDPWRDDFSYSRNRALDVGQSLVSSIDPNGRWYYLFMDADNLAFAEDGMSLIQVNKNRLDADAYEVQMRQGGSQYGYIWMVIMHPDKPWRWYGPCHEYISPIKDANKAHLWEPKQDKLDGGYVDSRREGNRSLDGRKYLRDALCFEKDLLAHPMDDRSLYYLAQSYKDAGKEVNQDISTYRDIVNNKTSSQEERDQAEMKIKQLTQLESLLYQRSEKAYHYRASAPPFHLWNDEYTYCAWVEAAKIRTHRKGKVDQKAVEYLMSAHQLRPHRLEAAYHLVNYYLQVRAYRVGWSFAKELCKLPYPKDEHIFVEDGIHRYGFIFEASLCAFYAGDKDSFITLSKLVIRNPVTPDNIKQAAKSNLDKFGK